jgi:hypothetical protein
VAEYHLDNTVFCRGSSQIQLSIGMSELPKSCRSLSTTSLSNRVDIGTTDYVYWHS